MWRSCPSWRRILLIVNMIRRCIRFCLKRRSRNYDMLKLNSRPRIAKENIYIWYYYYCWTESLKSSTDSNTSPKANWLLEWVVYLYIYIRRLLLHFWSLPSNLPMPEFLTWAIGCNSLLARNRVFRSWLFIVWLFFDMLWYRTRSAFCGWRKILLEEIAGIWIRKYLTNAIGIKCEQIPRVIEIRVQNNATRRVRSTTSHEISPNCEF